MIKDTIRKDLTQALKNKEVLKISTLRMMLAEIVNKEKEKGQDIDEDAAVKVFFTMIKKREEAAKQYEDAGRADSAQKERDEGTIIKDYLPPQLGEDEIRAAAGEVISQVGAQDLKGLGKVMGVLSKQLSGKASGAEISRIVKEELGKLSKPSDS
jgi:uncharacterized protein YqeY